MSKLKNIIRQLSDEDFKYIYNHLMDNSAEKSALLLKYLKEKQLSDNKIMTELEVNSNAYYTLRSRLNEKIEEYLVTQMESPKTEILRRVANVNELMFTKKRTIIIATLKKLEKELIDYDLSNELIIIYKSLKKLHINTSDHYHFSQLYNKHIAFNLAMDKAEDLLTTYFTKYGQYYLSNDPNCVAELAMLLKEIDNIANLYQSHRLFIYQSCASIFHEIMFNPKPNNAALLQNFEKAERIFDQYASDGNYHHLRLVFDFLRLLMAWKQNDIQNNERYWDEVNYNANVFLSNFSFYTFTPLFLTIKLDTIQSKVVALSDILEETKMIFADFECDTHDTAKYVSYHCYMALLYYYNDKYELAAKTINLMFNEVGLKKYPVLMVEIKTFLCVLYCLMDEYDLYVQTMSSVQRQIRMLGRKQFDYIITINKIMKISLTGTGRSKGTKIRMTMPKLNLSKIEHYTPLKYILLKPDLAEKLSS
ncbi:MAG: hypothetical protein NW207_10930 [Cytophagales bacterium]|nr:hypothetical protein [Cytophagales bacterium]